MQGLSTNHRHQEKVQQLVVAAREAGSATIAERVEDANTMAVLWQFGVGFVQGYLLNKPEEVVLG
jgi:multidomain signaling protein FimX